MTTKEIFLWSGIGILLIAFTTILIVGTKGCGPRDLFAEASEYQDKSEALAEKGKVSAKEYESRIRDFVQKNGGNGGKGGNCSQDQQTAPGTPAQQDISEDSVLRWAKKIAVERKYTREIEDAITGSQQVSQVPAPATAPTPTPAPTTSTSKKNYKSGGSSQTKTTIINNNNYYNNSSRDDGATGTRETTESTNPNSNSSRVDNSSQQNEERTTTMIKNRVRIDQVCKPVLKPELVKKYGLTTKMVGRQEMVVYPDGTPYRGEYGHPFVDGTKKEDGTIIEKNYR